MRIGLMVEGQAGLTWERWIHILHTAERLGIPSVFRSDHYVIGRYQSSIDAYLSFAIAAMETSNIRFGPLVNPITFRSPVDVGRMAAQVNQLSNGRFLLGLGAGWHQPEHDAYGIYYPPTGERFDRLEEGIQVIKTLWGIGPASFAGKFYNVTDVDCLPKPVSGADTPILIGGSGPRRTLPLVAKYADEWNCVNVPLDQYRDKVEQVERLCDQNGRDPSGLRRSMMRFGLIADDPRSLDRITRYHMSGSGATGSPAAYREEMASTRNFLVGLTSEVVDTIGEYEALGVEEIQFEHFNYASDEVPTYLAKTLAPQVA
jgi:F420-dependent oxidoreductase-like protein